VNSMPIIMERIEKLSKQEKKTLLQRMVKLQEECGELAQEVLVNQNASGSQYKEAGADGVLGECVDVTLVALSIYFSSGGTVDELAGRLETKSLKWEKHQMKG
jgi:NTP pyrophosphatase (non-canonical NTP hydrolase)